MAYSPSPVAVVSQNAFNNSSRSPRLYQNLTKREKRKAFMEDRFAQISQEFNDNREAYYRKQLHTFQLNTDFIRNSNLYANKPLDELIEDPTEDLSASAAASTQGSVRTLNPNGNTRVEMPWRHGVSAARYSREIDDVLEQRDADLTMVAYRHNFRIDELQRDYEFNVSVAHQEHRRLLDTLRRRLISNLKSRKSALQKEKEKLDIADTNALLYHPNQFSLNNGASPGGPQSNRKTRHTRHRLEVDDLDTTSSNYKKKRKALADADSGSPAPPGREVEPANAFKEASEKLEYHQVAAPIYSLDRLFMQKELDSNLQLATCEVVEDLKRRKLNKDSTTNINPIIGINVDSSDTEANTEAGAGLDGAAEDMFLGAPEMERTATSASQHLTRSTRGLIPLKRTSGPEGLGNLAGRASGAAFIGNCSLKEKKREDDYNRAPPLSDLEADDDIAVMKAATEDQEAGKPNPLLVESAVEIQDREDYVGTGSVEGGEDENDVEA